MHARFLGLAAALLLAACSGSDDGYATPAPVDPLVSGSQVPTSATTSSAGATAFVLSISATPSDTAEPLELGDALLAVSDSGEPVD